MFNLIGTPMISGDLFWQVIESNDHIDHEEGAKVVFHLSSFSKPFHKRNSIKRIEHVVLNNNLSWIKPGYNEWTFNLDTIAKEHPELENFSWFTGIVKLVPEFEAEERTILHKSEYVARIVFYIVKEVVNRRLNLANHPIEIQESLKKFQREYPDPSKVCFIIMKFGETSAHSTIVTTIKSFLLSKGIIGLRADDKQYHDDLFPNILTYIYGSAFGLAVFERIEADDFNPNVSLEVGYMMALGKPLCLLKDKTHRTLPSDLIGKLYRSFDTHEPEITIEKELSSWLEDRDLI